MIKLHSKWIQVTGIHSIPLMYMSIKLGIATCTSPHSHSKVHSQHKSVKNQWYIFSLQCEVLEALNGMMSLASSGLSSFCPKQKNKLRLLLLWKQQKAALEVTISLQCLLKHRSWSTSLLCYVLWTWAFTHKCLASQTIVCWYPSICSCCLLCNLPNQYLCPLLGHFNLKSSKPNIVT